MFEYIRFWFFANTPFARVCGKTKNTPEQRSEIPPDLTLFPAFVCLIFAVSDFAARTTDSPTTDGIMGLAFSRLWERMFGKKEMRILMVRNRILYCLGGGARLFYTSVDVHEFFCSSRPPPRVSATWSVKPSHILRTTLW